MKLKLAANQLVCQFFYEKQALMVFDVLDVLL